MVVSSCRTMPPWAASSPMVAAVVAVVSRTLGATGWAARLREAMSSASWVA